MKNYTFSLTKIKHRRCSSEKINLHILIHAVIDSIISYSMEAANIGNLVSHT